jgi:hypothetical protein
LKHVIRLVLQDVCSVSEAPHPFALSAILTFTCKSDPQSALEAVPSDSLKMSPRKPANLPNSATPHARQEHAQSLVTLTHVPFVNH